ncbi:Bug family tripartite tricarboxylate transporter substrate binding protein [Pelagibacterium luteolum]|uniref:Tripartite-type tricarboxylate transporter, receptor component TctC n=1 Tax=Pelagibacterium luteolum TaxID=440168 RepID=A0A1G8AB89_9HYPH|nr:tripartite tricarboxylate transporter substrate binding protein [Pelagibacterium luteolum]SDH18123.1 Tripartite-type tricarboxylate transporter, receptor component TctC [Pelagibacterium luteolum]
MPVSTSILPVAMLALATISALATPAFAEWPLDKPVKIIVPATPGGMVDIPSRLAAEALARQTGGNFILEHRPGAGGTIGTQALLSEPTNGYSILLISSAAAIAPTLYPDTIGDPREDLVPISLALEIPIAIMVPTDSPIDSLETMIDMAEQVPGGLAYASGGTGSGNHLTSELLQRETGIEMVHIPYGGVSAASTGMLSRETDLAFTSYAAAKALADSGQARIIAITGESRLEIDPDIPTASETVPGFVSINWFGFVGAKGFPLDIRDTIKAELEIALTDGETVERARTAGVDLIFSGPEPLADHIEQDLQRYSELLQSIDLSSLR